MRNKKHPSKDFELSRYFSVKYEKEVSYEKFGNSINYGIICGKTSNNLVVIDFDQRELYDSHFADINTLTVETPSGGTHLYVFTKKLIRKEQKYKGWSIDIQSQGSYAVIPPSCVIEEEKGYDGYYKVIKDKLIKTYTDISFLDRRLPKQKKPMAKGWKKVVERLKREIDLSEYIEQYVDKVRESKSYWQGLCPFHPDTNPSFTVYRDHYYCFGCGEYGDLIDFLQKIEGLEFKEAVKKLCKRYDIPLPRSVEEKKEGKPIIRKSLLEFDGKLAEQIFDGVNSRFAVFDGEKVGYVDKIELNGFVYLPYDPEESKELIERAVLLPEEAEDFGTLDELIEEIRNHIHRYVDISEDYEIFSTYYILLTWIYDKLNTLSYLRVLGDTGCGKSRFSDVVGRLCYKATICSGAITPAPIYRMIRKWKGTIILDEADLRKSDEKNEVVTILNCGFERGRPVIRSSKDNPDDLQVLPTFSPKILATRGKMLPWKPDA